MLTRGSARMRILTTPAQEEYEVWVDIFQRKLSSIKSEWRECFDEIERSSSVIITLKSIDDLVKDIERILCFLKNRPHTQNKAQMSFPLIS